MNITREDLEKELLESITKDVNKQYPNGMTFLSVDDKQWWERCFNNRIKETARTMLTNITVGLSVEEVVALIIHAESIKEMKKNEYICIR